MLFRLKRFSCAALFAAVLLSGCGPGTTDLRESRDPMVRRARDLKSAGDLDGAISSYNQALDQHGDLPQTHLEIATLYHQHKQDYISAIHHYQRFLALSPASQKTNLVVAEIRRAKMEYAASLPDRPSDAVQTIATMTTERELLQKNIKEKQDEVDRLKYQLAVAHAALVAATSRTPQAAAVQQQPAGAVAQQLPPATNAAPQLTYVVQPGDTLAKIARKFFRNDQMSHAIYAANKNTMKNDRDLRSGQKLILPPGARADGG